MFNIHSTEILLILIVALVVIGPDKLPSAIKTASLWIGRFRRSFYKVKSEIERELNADEIRRQLHNESVMAELEDARSDITGIAKETEESVNNIVNTDTFDPGASKHTDEQQEKDDAQGLEGKEGQEDQEDQESQQGQQQKSLKEELQEVKDEIEDVTKQLYGTGKNPKLANTESPAEEKPAKEEEEQKDKQDNDIS